MRTLPQIKRSSGYQIAGEMPDSGGGGGGGGGGGSSLPNYQFDTEVEVGTYNGKKLYRITKKVTQTNPTAPNWQSFKFDNVDDVFIDCTMSKVRFSGAELPVNYYLNTSNYVVAFVGRNTNYSYIDCRMVTTFSGSCDWIITVYYTKNTD